MPRAFLRFANSVVSRLTGSCIFLLLYFPKRGEGGAVYLHISFASNYAHATQRPYNARYRIFAASEYFHSTHMALFLKMRFIAK